MSGGNSIWRIAGVALLCLAPILLRAQPEASVRVAEEMAPAGGLAVIQIELTEPAPILDGRVTFRTSGTVLGNLCGIGLFSPSLDVVGAVTRRDDRTTEVRFVGFNGEVGTVDDLPVMVAALEVPTSALPGQQGELRILESELQLNAPNGITYRNDLKSGMFTVGGISITKVEPSKGIVEAGERITFRGVGFDSESKLDVDGVTLVSVQVVSPVEIRATAGETFRIDNRRIRLTNGEGTRDFFYSFTSTKLESQSASPLLRPVTPIFSGQELTEGVLPVLSIGTVGGVNAVTGVSLQNPGSGPISVTIDAFDPAGRLLGSTTISLAAGESRTGDIGEYIAGLAARRDGVIGIRATAPVQAVGLVGDDSDLAVSPVPFLDQAPPNPLPGTRPEIFSGGVVLSTLLPTITEISANAIVSVFGDNFTPGPSSVALGPEDLVDGRIPTRLADVCVEIDGTRSPIFFVSKTQINFQAAIGSGVSVASVTVLSNCGSADEVRSPPAAVNVSSRTPAFFVVTMTDANGLNPIAALDGGGSTVVGDPQVIAGAVPAEPG